MQQQNNIINHFIFQNTNVDIPKISHHNTLKSPTMHATRFKRTPSLISVFRRRTKWRHAHGFSASGKVEYVDADVILNFPHDIRKLPTININRESVKSGDKAIGDDCNVDSSAWKFLLSPWKLDRSLWRQRWEGYICNSTFVAVIPLVQSPNYLIITV